MTYPGTVEILIHQRLPQTVLSKGKNPTVSKAIENRRYETEESKQDVKNSYSFYLIVSQKNKKKKISLPDDDRLPLLLTQTCPLFI